MVKVLLVTGLLLASMVTGITVSKKRNVEINYVSEQYEFKRGALEDSERTIWTWWHGQEAQYRNTSDPEDMGAFVRLNLKTWKKYAPQMKIVILNDDNIKDYVPDMPDEFFKIPYQAAKSDVIRSALLSHHGGMYLDTDFVMMKPIQPILEKLMTHDILGYQDTQQAATGTDQCMGSRFASNFMAGRKGNAFSRIWFNNIKQRLTRVCKKGEFSVEKVCCHEEGTENLQACHVPWASLELIKDFGKHNPEAHQLSLLQTSSRTNSKRITALSPTFIEEYPKGLEMYCYKANDSFDPVLNYIYFQPWDEKNMRTKNVAEIPGGEPGNKENPPQYPLEFNHDRDECANDKAGTMHCTHRTIPNALGRSLYHLGFSHWAPEVPTTGETHLTEESVLASDWLVSAMWRKALDYPPLKK